MKNFTHNKEKDQLCQIDFQSGVVSFSDQPESYPWRGRGHLGCHGQFGHTDAVPKNQHLRNTGSGWKSEKQKNNTLV